MAHISTSQVEKFAETVVTELKGLLCCNKSKKRRIKLFQFWRKFHVMRLSPTIRDAWQECVDSLNLNNSIKNITMHEANITTVNAISVNVEGMTVREENVVRYVAGYVDCKVEKKFSEHAEFLGAFKGGFILDFTEDDLDDYTRVWTEQVDRGGLYHVSDTVFKFTVAIEYICRKYLDIRIASKQDLDIAHKITDDCYRSAEIAKLWKDCHEGASSKSQEIFDYIIQLWTRIRIHAYTKKWTSQLLETAKTPNKKSIRKTLKNKGTEKED